MSAGYDHIDTDALKTRGIVLGTSTFVASFRFSSPLLIFGASAAPDALTDATADVGAMLVLMASRRAGEVSCSALAFRRLGSGGQLTSLNV